MRKLRPREERGFPKVLLQVSSSVPASTAQNLVHSGSRRTSTTFPSISNFLELKPFVFCFTFTASTLRCHFSFLVKEQKQCWQASAPREAWPSPGPGPRLQKRTGVLWMEQVRVSATSPPPSNYYTQTQSLLSDAETQESSKLDLQLATSLGLFRASRDGECNLS